MADAAHKPETEKPGADTTPASDKAKPESTAATGTAATPEKDAPATTPGAMQVQKKSVVGSPNDATEREADGVADKVRRAADAGAPAAETPEDKAAAGAAPAGGADTVRRQAAPTAAPAEVDKEASAAGKEAEQQEKANAPPEPTPNTNEPGVPESVQTYLDASAMGGTPLSEAARRAFESKLSADLGDVRLHDDPGAHEAARAIGALAFTRGNHVYFAGGAYDPNSPTGQALIAHELTHVLQQTGAKPLAAAAADSEAKTGRTSQPAEPGQPPPTAPPPPAPLVAPHEMTRDAPGSTLRRKKEDKKEKSDHYPKDADKPKVDTRGGVKVRVPSLSVPSGKRAAIAGTAPFTLKKDARTDGQRKVWEDAVRPVVQPKVTNKIKGGSDPEKIHYLRYGSGAKAGQDVLIGTTADIVEIALRPRWNKEGNPESFDVDHIVDWQLGGDDVIGNLHLLQSSANRSAGSLQKNAINTAINGVLTEANDYLTRKVGIDRAKKGEVTIEKVTGDLSVAGTWTTWKKADMGKAADGLKVVPNKDLDEIRGTEEKPVLYSGRHGGARMEINKSGWTKPGYKVTSVDIQESKGSTGRVGTVQGSLFPNTKTMKPKRFSNTPIMGIKGVDWGGYLDPNDAGLKSGLAFDGMSDVDLLDATFDVSKGLVAKARIPKPSIPLLNNVEIDLSLDGNAVVLSATVTADALTLPGPISLTGGFLTISASTTEGLGVEGELSLAIGEMAKGKLSGRRGGHGFALKGEIDFDSDMFDRAHAEIEYKGDKLSGRGDIRVGNNKIKGIKSASGKIEIDDKNVTAEGSFEPAIPKLKKGELKFSNKEGEGMSITGRLELGALPGIKGGTIEATVKQGAEGYSLSGEVSAEPALPGVTGGVKGRFDDGAFLAEANLGYRRGMLSGSVKLGLTNQAVGPDKKPAGPPTEKLTVYGGGQVTLKITPWLHGTIGVELLENGEMVVTGKIALPEALNLFEEKKLEKNLLSIGIDIPIIGVAVAGQRIGIFATIGGGLDFKAAFGPGQLRALSLEVTYNPEREADTRISGKAELFVPAFAGLKLFVNGGIGAGIPIVSATAGVKIGGELGLGGALTANVNVDWLQSRGLVIDAKGSIFVEPKFRFSISAYVDVSADLLLTTIELYKKEWELAAFEYGSGLRLGIAFPIHYEEGKDFNLSMDQVELTYPQINPSELLSGLMKKLV